MKRYQVIEAFGLTVIEVPDLRTKVALVKNYDIALVRSGLAGDEQDRAIDWLLHQCLDPSRQRQ